MSQSIKIFLQVNKVVLIGILIGAILGYIYWEYIGCYWGTYPLSAVCWINCLTGGIMGGFVCSFWVEER